MMVIIAEHQEKLARSAKSKAAQPPYSALVCIGRAAARETGVCSLGSGGTWWGSLGSGSPCVRLLENDARRCFEFHGKLALRYTGTSNDELI